MNKLTGKIAEVFTSIQGEGIYQGRQQVFVRFFGCNLTCKFCDTNLSSYQELSLDELISKLSSADDYHSVSLTGGEPLLQVDFLSNLARRLKEASKIVYLETNGTLYSNLRQVIDNIDIIAMDFKLPSSTEMKDYWFEHREFLKIASAKDVFIKTVIGKSTRIEDLRIALAIIKEVAVFKNSMPRPVAYNFTLVLQPQNPQESELEEKLNYFKKICHESHFNVKIIPQLHKALGVK